MQYLLPCDCGQSVAVSRAQAGATIQCPSCAASLEIPTIRGMSKLATVESGSEKDSTESGKATKQRTSSSGKSVLQTSLTALFFAVFVVAGVTTARWAVIRFMNPTIYTVEDEIAEGEKILSQFSPADAWDAWQYYQTNGCKEKNASPYYRMKRGMELQDESMKTGAIVTLVSFLGLMSTVFWPKRKING